MASLSPFRARCKIALLAPIEYEFILNYLSLSDLSRFYEALNSSQKTKEGAKSIISYIAKH